MAHKHHLGKISGRIILTLEFMQSSGVDAKESSGNLADGGIQPDRVHEVLARHLNVDGFTLVVDTRRSTGSHLVDAVTGTSNLDLYTFFASSPLGKTLKSTPLPDRTR